jgi:hypothetical protein
MISELVKKLLLECKFSQVAVSRRLERLAAKDDSLRAEIWELGKKQAIRLALTSLRHEPLDRSRAIPTIGSAEEEFERVEDRLFWNCFTLFGGTPIRLATKAALTESVQSYRTLAKGNARRADFAQAVITNLMKHAKPNDTVEKVTTNAAVTKLALKFELIEQPKKNNRRDPPEDHASV